VGQGIYLWKKGITISEQRGLREGVRRKRLQKWWIGDWFLHHDNAAAYLTLSVSGKKLHDCYIPQIRDPVTFSFFQNSSWHWRKEDLMTSSRFKNNRRLTCRVQNTGLLQMLSTMAWALDSLCHVERELLQSGQHGVASKRRYLRNKNKFGNLLPHSYENIYEYALLHAAR
jgi:hypothetical protein